MTERRTAYRHAWVKAKLIYDELELIEHALAALTTADPELTERCNALTDRVTEFQRAIEALNT